MLQGTDMLRSQVSHGDRLGGHVRGGDRPRFLELFGSTDQDMKLFFFASKSINNSCSGKCSY